MNQVNANVISVLGLPKAELRLLTNMLKLTANRTLCAYKLYEGEGFFDSDIVIINVDDTDSMALWQENMWREGAPIPVLVTSNALVYSSENYFLRPLSPVKLMAVLDRLIIEKQIQQPDKQIFTGKNKVDTPSQISANGHTAFRHALVVDDSPTVRKQLEIELRAINVNVDLAESGEAGLELLEANYYDIIFLDVVLPGDDGYQICKRIKKNPVSKQTPVVMLTSKSSPFDRVRGSLAGCDSYLTKPVDYEKFRQVLEKYKLLLKVRKQSG